jgi:endonuclease/exonuclease/phosphatase family metal-dependent hydrolase
VPDLSLATFNTHYGFRPYRFPPRTPYDVLAAMKELDTQVVVVQEHWRPDGVRGVVDDAADTLGYEVEHELTGPGTGRSRWPHLTRDGEGTVGIAVLSRLPVRRVGTIALGPTFRDPAPNRTALHVEIDVDGTPVQVVAVHLTSRLPHGPPAQLRRLARAVPSADELAIVAGDCNFWGPGVVSIMRGWRRAARGRTWPASSPHSQIDHILVRSAIEVRAGEVVRDVGSDHRPVRAELSF